MKLEEIKEIVKQTLSEKRFHHSECVMKRCIEIAEKLDYDMEIAAKVGIAHDIAKEIPPDEKIKYMEDNNIEIDEIERENTSLLHAKIGKDIAIKKFEFTEEMGQAIRAHTTGMINMSLLDKILFIADRTSEERGFPDIDLINKLLEKNIDEAVLYIMDKKIMLQIEKKATMHPDSIFARNYILREIMKNKGTN